MAENSLCCAGGGADKDGEEEKGDYCHSFPATMQGSNSAQRDEGGGFPSGPRRPRL